MVFVVIFIFLAFLITAKQLKLVSKSTEKKYQCSSSYKLQLVETIPSGMVYGQYQVTNPKIVDKLKMLILSAKKTIDIASSYWTLRESDVKGGPYPMAKVGEEIFDGLVNAARDRGIQIRIVHQVFCKKGKCMFPTNDTDTLSKIKNVRIRTLDLDHLQGSGIIHTKMWIVDGQHMYLGSANMDWRSYTEVKELGLMTYDCQCLAGDMSKIFDAYWLLAQPQSVIPKKWPDSYNTMFNKDNPLLLQGNNSATRTYFGSSPPSFCPSNRTSDIDAILHTMKNAKKFIHIAVMDYLTAFIYSYPKRYWGVIDNALRSAAYDRGVSIKILASNWSHTKPEMIPMLKSLQAFSSACRNGSIQIKLFTVPPGRVKIPFTRVNHNKYMVTESTAYVGTSNWSGDYFADTAGIGYVVSQSHNDNANLDIQTQLDNVFLRDWNSPPGSGKGTIASRIVRDFGLLHLSSGDLLRSQISAGTEAGLKAKQFIDSGGLVPDGPMIDLIVAELKKLKSSWLLDGFPRTNYQAETLQKHHALDLVLNLDVPFSTIRERLQLRWIHEASGRVYNLDWNPPKNPGVDDVTGERLIQREDDKPETVTARLNNYEKATAPVLNFYESLKILKSFHGTESNVIYPVMKDYLTEFMKKHQ
eukprot:gene8275-9159_t